ncbi:MAG: ABC transporter permease [Candidatus Hydrogenedentota bacterium]
MNAWAVCKRDFASYFSTPVGYIVVATYSTISGLGFFYSFSFYSTVTQSPSTFGYAGIPDFEETLLSPFLVFSGMLVMFIGPLVTMRLLAEERNRGTMELLLTYPLRDRDIVFGKFGAALLMLFVQMAVVAVHLLVVNYFVNVEPAVLVFGYATVFLMGAAFFSMGLFVSSLCSNQITAATATFGMFFVFYIVGSEADDLSDANPAPDSWPEGPRQAIGQGAAIVRALIRELPLDKHAEEMAKGILQPYDIAYYVLFTAFFLFLTFRSLESRRWRA